MASEPQFSRKYETSTRRAQILDVSASSNAGSASVGREGLYIFSSEQKPETTKTAGGSVVAEVRQLSETFVFRFSRRSFVGA